MGKIYQSWDIAVAITLLGTIVVVVYGFLIYKAIVKYNKESLLIKEQFEQLKNIQEKIILETEIEIREQTFQYISQEIHDNITQSLSLANLILNCIDKDAEDFKSQLSKSKTQLAKALNDLNDLSKSLDSDIIKTHGIAKAIHFEIEKWRKFYPNDVFLETNGAETNLDSTKELFLFRIVQESLNNILKHAKANLVKISISYLDNSIKATIEDNGIGFNPELLGQQKEAYNTPRISDQEVS